MGVSENHMVDIIITDINMPFMDGTGPGTYPGTQLGCRVLFL